MNKSRSIGELLIPSAAIAFFFSVFVPVNSYINNSQEFLQIRPWMLLGISLMTFLCLYLIVLGVFMFCALIGRRTLSIVVTLCCCVTIAFYVQGNLINLNYGVLDGRAIPWDKMIGAGIVNLTIWEAIVLAGLWACFKFKERIGTYIKIVLSCFLGYITLITVMRFSMLKVDSSYPVDYTFDRFMSVSSKHNVFVFIVDTLEQGLFEEMLKTNPDLRKVLRGFTYYKNTIGKFPTTKGALPQIITGVANDNTLPFTAYKEKAYLDSEIYPSARDSGLSVDVYTGYTFAPTEKAMRNLDCIKNVAVAKPCFLDAVNYFVTAINSSIFSYLPHFLKRYYSAFEVPFVRVKSKGRQGLNGILIENEFFRHAAGDYHNLTADSEEGMVKFYHTEGVHAPTYTIDKGCKCIKMIAKFLNAVHRIAPEAKNDVIILADHGHVEQHRPVFLCNNSKGEFVENDTPFSYDDLGKVIVGAIRGEGLHVPRTEGLRTFFFYSWDNGKWDVAYLPQIFKRQYDTFGNFAGVAGFKPKEVYVGADFPSLSTTGIVIDGTYPNVWMWTFGSRSTFRLPIKHDAIGKDLTLAFTTRALLNERMRSQEVGITVNGSHLGTEKYTYPDLMSKTLSVSVPKECNTNEMLDVVFSIKSPIRADFWNPPNPGTRPLGVMLTQISARPQEVAGCHSFGFSYVDLKFCELVSGIAQGEQHGRWSNATNSVVKIKLPRNFCHKSVGVNIDYHLFLPKGKIAAQRVKVEADGAKLIDDKLSKPGVQTMKLKLTPEMTKDGVVELKFTLPDAASPSELGVGNDPRKLAIFLRSCKMEIAE